MPAEAQCNLPGPLIAVKAWATAAEAGKGPSEGAEGPQFEAARALIEEIHRRAEAQRKELNFTRAALEEALVQVKQFRPRLIQEAEQQLVDLAVDIARRVLMQEIQAGRYEIEPIVKEALGRVPAHCDVVVHLNPEDYNQCEIARQADEAAARQPPDPAGGDAGEAGTVRFVADPNIRRAECLLETSEGTVASGIEENLSQVGEALKRDDEDGGD
jgi:flagellar assembly protein FliH